MTPLARLADDPDDLAAYAEVAAALTAAGDPRGELVELEVSLAREPRSGGRVRRRRDRLAAELEAAVQARIPAATLRWRMGFVDEIGGLVWSAGLAPLIRDPHGPLALVRALGLHAQGGAAALDVLAAFPALRRLVLTLHDRRARQGGPPLPALPRLTELALHATGPLPPLALPRLVQLVLHTTTTDGAWELPALRSLAWHAPAAWRGDVEAAGAALAGLWTQALPALRQLALCATLDDRVLRQAAARAWLARVPEVSVGIPLVPLVREEVAPAPAWSARVERGAATRIDDALAMLDEMPENHEAYLVIADELQAVGDPRGELIALEHAVAYAALGGGQQGRRRDKLRARAVAGFARAVPGCTARWRLGFVDQARLTVADPGALAALCGSPDARLVTALELELDAAPAALASLALLDDPAACPLRSLRQLTLVGRAVRPVLPVLALAALPQLARLAVRRARQAPVVASAGLHTLELDDVGDIPAAAPRWQLPALRTLVVPGGLSAAARRAVLAACPQLTEIVVHPPGG